jgi:hypothetical protein
VNIGQEHLKKFFANKATIMLEDTGEDEFTLNTPKSESQHFKSIRVKHTSLREKTNAAAKVVSERLYYTNTYNKKRTNIRSKDRLK